MTDKVKKVERAVAVEETVDTADKSRRAFVKKAGMAAAAAPAATMLLSAKATKAEMRISGLRDDDGTVVN